MMVERGKSRQLFILEWYGITWCESVVVVVMRQ